MSTPPLDPYGVEPPYPPTAPPVPPVPQTQPQPPTYGSVPAQHYPQETPQPYPAPYPAQYPPQYPPHYAARQPAQHAHPAAWHPAAPAGPWQMPVPRRRTSALAAGLGWVMLGLGILVLVMAVVPWGTVTLHSGQTCRVPGVSDGGCGPFTDTAYDLGGLTIVLSVPVMVMGVLRGCIRRAGLALASAIVALVLGVLIVLVSATGTSAPDGLPATARFSTSYGLWLTLALGIMLAAVGIWGIVKRR